MTWRIAIVGTREPVWGQVRTLAALVETFDPGAVVVSGAARGIDQAAARLAREHGLAVVEYPADWETHGNAAGFVRNQTIVDNCDEVHAFPGAGRGTWDTIRKARKAGKPLTVYGADGRVTERSNW